MSETERKYGLLVAALVLGVAILSFNLGLTISIPFLIVGLGLWTATIFKRLRVSRPLLRSCQKFVTIGLVIGVGSSLLSNAAEKQRTARLENFRSEISKIHSLISSEKIAEASAALRKLDNPDQFEVEQFNVLLQGIQLLVSEAKFKDVVFGLEKNQFDSAAKGTALNLSSDKDLNRLLNKKLQQKVGGFKKEYYALRAAESKLKKAKEKAEAEERASLARFGEPPHQSEWDGSYHEVKEYLRNAANDPESIKVEGRTTVKKDKHAGWIVGCDYRGRNGFGGLVKQSNWFVIRHGRVVKVEDPSSYR